MFYPKIQLLIQQGRFENAEAAIREELTNSMEDAFLFYLLSISLLNQDRPKEAEKAARESIRLEPEFDLGFFMLSRVLLARENKKEALEAINEAIRIDPEDADNHSQKAQVYLDWGKYELSLEAADAGLALYPEHEGCRFFRSILLEKLGRKEEADAESLSLLSDDPEDAENHSVRGWVLVQRGDCEGAERHFVEALRIDPESGDARNGLAFAFKLRRPVLGGILRALIWIERIPMWWAIIGIFLIMRFGDKLASSEMPTPIPQIGSALRILLWTFFVMALLIHPLFNWVLSRSKTARHALSDDELRGVKWYAAPIIVAFIFLAMWIWQGTGKFAPVHVLVWAAVARLVYEVFETSNFWVKRWMTGMAFLGLGIAIWVEYATWGMILPQLKSLMAQIKLLKGSGDEEMLKELVERYSKMMKFSLDWTFWPALGSWFLAAFADDLREFFTRRAPDS